MSQAYSFNPLISPQELLFAQQRSAAMPQSGQSAQSAPVNMQRFSQVSGLLSPDQLQTHVAANNSQSLLLDPVALFSAPSKVPLGTAGSSLPSLSSPRPQIRPSLPALNLADIRHGKAAAGLETMQPEELKHLGAQDKKAFFEALLPAAIESEKEFGVPAELTLAQAALESAWARSPIGGYNIFGIKGSGPAGKTSVNTKEYLNGKWVQVKDGFAKYHNFNQAVKEHGELFHNGYYDKAVNQYSRDKNVYAFIDNIQGIYATDPAYDKKIKSIIEDYGLDKMVNNTGMV